MYNEIKLHIIKLHVMCMYNEIKLQHLIKLHVMCMYNEIKLQHKTTCNVYV